MKEDDSNSKVVSLFVTMTVIGSIAGCLYAINEQRVWLLATDERSEAAIRLSAAVVITLFLVGVMLVLVHNFRNRRQNVQEAREHRGNKQHRGSDSGSRNPELPGSNLFRLESEGPPPQKRTARRG